MHDAQQSTSVRSTSRQKPQREGLNVQTCPRGFPAGAEVLLSLLKIFLMELLLEGSEPHEVPSTGNFSRKPVLNRLQIRRLIFIVVITRDFRCYCFRFPGGSFKIEQ